MPHWIDISAFSCKVIHTYMHMYVHRKERKSGYWTTKSRAVNCKHTVISLCRSSQYQWSCISNQYTIKNRCTRSLLRSGKKGKGQVSMEGDCIKRRPKCRVQTVMHWVFMGTMITWWEEYRQRGWGEEGWPHNITMWWALWRLGTTADTFTLKMKTTGRGEREGKGFLQQV